MAFRAKFWNLGLEGQMIWGAIGATAISLFEVGPPALRHRLRRNPLDDAVSSTRVARAVDEVIAA